jgi:RecA-family ATPase
LILPVTDRSGVCRGAELIDSGGLKCAIAGTAKTGNVWLPSPIPPGCPVVAVAEGMATAVTATETVGWPAVAALSSSNLKAACQRIHQDYPSAQIVVLADLDKKTGQAHPDAIAAADAAGARLAVPAIDVESGDDWSDFFVTHGQQATAEALLAVLATPAPTHPAIVTASALRAALALANELPDALSRAIELQTISKAHGIGSKPDSLERFITEAERGQRRKFPLAPADLRTFAVSQSEMRSARLSPRCVVENYLFADVALLCGGGSSGKTSLLLWECLHVALGRPLYGLAVREPGPCLIITGEDSRERLLARLHCIMNALEPPLTETEIHQVESGIVIWDVSGQSSRLIENDPAGEVMPTGFADAVIEAARPLSPVMVVLDPLISFHGSARLNDTEQGVILEARRVVRGLNTCLRIVHHVGQNTARTGVMDQYAGRGGTALADGARMVAVLAPWNQNSKDTPPRTLQTGDGVAVLKLARPKTSYAPPQSPIWIARDGYRFTWATDAPPPAPERQLAGDADQLLCFIRSELTQGRRHTRSTLEQARPDLGMTRDRLRRALAELDVARRITDEPLPADQRRIGGRKSYLCPLPHPTTREGGQ